VPVPSIAETADHRFGRPELVQQSRALRARLLYEKNLHASTQVLEPEIADFLKSICTIDPNGQGKRSWKVQTHFS